MVWNYLQPEEVGNYICDMAGDGISLAWWNGKDWIKMWGSEVVNFFEPVSGLYLGVEGLRGTKFFYGGRKSYINLNLRDVVCSVSAYQMI